MIKITSAMRVAVHSGLYFTTYRDSLGTSGFSGFSSAMASCCSSMGSMGWASSLYKYAFIVLFLIGFAVQIYTISLNRARTARFFRGSNKSRCAILLLQRRAPIMKSHTKGCDETPTKYRIWGRHLLCNPPAVKHLAVEARHCRQRFARHFIKNLKSIPINFDVVIFSKNSVSMTLQRYTAFL